MLRAIKNENLAEIIRKGFKKYVYSIDFMGMYVLLPKDCISSKKNYHYITEIWGSDKYHEILNKSPYLTQDDIDKFDKCVSKCIVALDNDKVIASLWMVRGEYYIKELGRKVTIGNDEYYSCRAFVHPDYRGQDLFRHLKTYFSKNYALPNEKVISFVFKWNIPSIKSNIKMGCIHKKDLEFITFFGMKWTKNRSVK